MWISEVCICYPSIRQFTNIVVSFIDPTAYFESLSKSFFLIYCEYKNDIIVCCIPSKFEFIL
ncbi:hypothetical protein DQW50_16425 [Halorubrum sp. 48-1-W]|nr:hypothetical protein DQW50_16425 [Halorubrum sp. 48-1-W]